MSHYHVLSADDIAGPEQHRVAETVRGLQRLVHTVHGMALGTGDLISFQQCVKLFPVFRHVDALAGGAQDGHTPGIQEFCQVDGGLTAKCHDNAYGLLHFDDVHHVFLRQRLEIQTVRGVVVRGNGLGVVVDDHDFIPQLLKGPDAVHRGVVEFDALPDADGPGTQDDDHRFARTGMASGFAVDVESGVEVRGLGRKLGGTGIHHFINSGLCRAGKGFFPGQGKDRMIGVAQIFSQSIEFRRQARRELLFKLRQTGDPGQKPPVDLCDRVDLLHGKPALKCFKYSKQTQIIRPCQAFRQGSGVRRSPVQGLLPDLRAADGLHQGHLKGGSDGHDFTGGFHLRAQLTGCVSQFVKGPFGELHHHIVQCRLKAGAGLAGDVVLDLGQGVAQGDLGGDLRDGIAGGLAGQGGGAGHTGVDLDDRVLKTVRVQRQLHIAAADDPQMLNDIQGGSAEHLIFLVAQGQRGSHHDAVAGVDPYRIHILHGTHGDDVAESVPHGLKFDLFPSGDGTFDEDLGDGGGFQTGMCDEPQLLGVVCGSSSTAAQCIGRADNDRVADFICRGESFLYGHGDARWDHRLPDLLHGAFEQFAVFSPGNGLDVGAQQADLVFLQDSGFRELHRQRQSSLSAQPC